MVKHSMVLWTAAADCIALLHDEMNSLLLLVKVKSHGLSETLLNPL